MKIFKVILYKEFISYINSATAYVILVPFLAINAFLYLRSALMLNDADLRPMMELLPWFLMIIGPALSMKTFADEQKKDTLELLFAHPLSEWKIALAKFFGLMCFYLVMLGFTLPLAGTLFIFSKPDVGQLAGQYLGAILVGGVFIATGIASSVLTKNAIGSFLAGLAVNFVLVMMGMNFVTLLMPGIIGRFVYEAAILNHVASMSRGVIDLRDVLYFGTLIFFALSMVVLSLSNRKVVENFKEKQKLFLSMVLVIGVGLLGNLIAFSYPLRLDLTTDKRYTMSDGTVKLIKSLPDLVTISVYTSTNLPAPMQITLKETRDWLSDFSRYSSKIKVKNVIVDQSEENKSEALGKGMREIQFNRIGASSFQVQTGFFGIEVRYGDRTETIVYVSDSSNFEYQLSRMIYKLTNTSKQEIGYMNLSKNTAEDLMPSLTESYTVNSIGDQSKEIDNASVSAVLVIDDGSELNQQSAALLKKFLDKGGNVLALVDGMHVVPQSMLAENSKSQVPPTLNEWGVTINGNLAFDTQLNESVTMGSGSVRYIIPYPFWMRALIDEKPKNSILAGLNSVLLGWPSTVVAQQNNQISTTPLIVSGNDSAGVQEENFDINPQNVQKLTAASGQKTLGLIAQKGKQKVVVIGDSDLVSDDFWKNAQENQILITNLIDQVVQNPVLSTITKRGSSRNVFRFASMNQVLLVQYGNIIGSALVSAIFGALWLIRRKRLTKRSWENSIYAN